MGIEYIFLNENFRELFVQFVLSMGIQCTARNDEMGALVVELPDDLDDAVLDAIDAQYELLTDEQEQLAEADEGWLTCNAMGVDVRLADGRNCIVRIPAEFIRRLTAHFSPQEIHSLISAIAQGVENPLDGPVCKILQA